MDTSEEMSQLEHIRIRAGMYIGKLGDGTYPNDGVYTLLREVLHYVVNEFWEGYGKRVEVRIEDKQTITIRDYGRGLSFEERYANSKQSPKMAVDLLTCLGIDTVNALSSWMDICVYGKGTVTVCHNEEGLLLGEWTEKTKRKDGISITFIPDENIFGPFQFKEDIIFEMLREISFLNVGLEFVYKKFRMKSKNGIADLLAYKMESIDEYLYPIIHFKNEIIEIAFTHSEKDDERFYSFTNGIRNYKGGVHQQAFKKAVADVLLELYPSERFIPTDVCSGMMGAISLYIENPMMSFVNGRELGSGYTTKDESCTIDEYIHIFFCERFRKHLIENSDVCEIIYKRMLEAKNLRSKKSNSQNR